MVMSSSSSPSFPLFFSKCLLFSFYFQASFTGQTWDCQSADVRLSKSTLLLLTRSWQKCTSVLLTLFIRSSTSHSPTLPEELHHFSSSTFPTAPESPLHPPTHHPPVSLALVCSLFAVGSETGTSADRYSYRQGGNAWPLKWNGEVGDVGPSSTWLVQSIAGGKGEKVTKTVQHMGSGRGKDGEAQLWEIIRQQASEETTSTV